MKFARNTTRWTLKTGSVLVLGALTALPLLTPAAAQADVSPFLKDIQRGSRSDDRGRDRPRDDNWRDNNRRDGNRRDDRWRNNGNWRNDNNRNDRDRWERERREREQRERWERERRERERRERERAERERRERWERDRRNDRWPGRDNGRWNIDRNWGGGRTGSYSFTGTVEDSRNQADTLWVRGDNGQTYSIRTRQAYRFRIGERVRVSGHYNSDNPTITSLGYRR